MNKYFFLFCCITSLLFVGCDKEDESDPDPDPDPEPTLPIDTSENKITIEDIQGIPVSVEFDRIAVEINGKWWEIIFTVESEYDGNSCVLQLPKHIDPDLLHPSERSKEEYGLGYWSAKSTDPLAGVAALGDFIAYNGDKKVGRVYLSDWSGTGSSASKAFIYYHYAEREFSLSGSDRSFRYSATFNAGWNAYANINSSIEESGALCTTTIPEDLDLQWHFESWIY